MSIDSVIHYYPHNFCVNTCILVPAYCTTLSVCVCVTLFCLYYFCLKEGVGYWKLCVPHFTAKHEREGLEESYQLPHEKDSISGAKAKGMYMCILYEFLSWVVWKNVNNVQYNTKILNPHKKYCVSWYSDGFSRYLMLLNNTMSIYLYYTISMSCFFFFLLWENIMAHVKIYHSIPMVHVHKTWILLVFFVSEVKHDAYLHDFPCVGCFHRWSQWIMLDWTTWMRCLNWSPMEERLLAPLWW